MTARNGPWKLASASHDHDFVWLDTDPFRELLGTERLASDSELNVLPQLHLGRDANETERQRCFDPSCLMAR